jgi:secreted trypsin-like serine protease
MRPNLRSILGSLILAASMVVAPASAAATSERADVTPGIIGGEPVASAPWAAGLYFDDWFGCSGSLIAARWVLTARHCVGSKPTHVLVGDVRRGKGTRANVSRVVITQAGDVALLRLATSINTTYAQLATADPPVGSTNYIYGWGTIEVGEEAPLSDVLKRGSVRVIGMSRDYFGGRAVETTKVNGTAGYGDSGGPQFYGDLVVGVCSTGDYVRTQYASVATHRNWIRSVAGV